MKVLLINPSRIYFQGQGSKGPRVGLPLGLMYMAAVLEKNSIPVKIFDSLISEATQIKEYPEHTYHGAPDDYLEKIIQKENPDIVGITSPFSTQVENAVRAVKIVKRVNPKIFVVAGGPHFSVRGRHFLEENQEVDVVVAGEGEMAMLELVKALENKRSYNDIKGLIFRDGESVKSNQPELIKDLDNLPFPAYHLVDMERYFHLLEKGLSTRPIKYQRAVSIITSRGCPFNCVFCAIHLHMGRLWRPHSVDYILSHIEYVIDKYQARHISFEDDNFTFDIQRCENLLDQILKRKIDITWDTPNGVRADRLNEALLIKMKQSNCQGLTVAAESGDQEVLDKIVHKSLKLENVIRVAKWCRKLKIKLGSAFIIGLPGETKKNIQKTLDFAFMLYKKFNVRPSLMIATPLFGTKLYEIVTQKNYLAKEITPRNLALATQTRGSGMIKTPEFNPQELKEFAKQLDVRVTRLNLIRKLTNPSQYFKILKMFFTKPSRLIFYLKRLT